jgi:transcriptional regulator with XRE-family HTH domain
MTDIDLVPQPYFGERLRRLRQQRGLKQTDLADIGLSASYISRIESGNRAVAPHVAQALARRLRVDISAFQSSREVYLARLLGDGMSNLAAGNHQAAADAFEAALESAAGAPLPVAWLIRHSLAISLGNLGRFADWQRQQTELVALATEADSPDLLTRAYTDLSNCLRQLGDVGEADSAAQLAYHHSRDPDVSPAHRVQAMIALIAAEAETGRAANAARRATELLGLIDDETPPSLRAQALWAAASAHVACGRQDEAVELLDRAVAGLRSGDDLVTWARLRLAAASLHRRAGQPIEEKVETCFREAAQVLRLTGIPIYQVQLDFIEAQLAFEGERFEEAAALCATVVDRAELLSFRDRARAEMLLAQAKARAGDPEQAMRELRAVAQRLDEADARHLSAEAWRLVAELALAVPEGQR